jgi:hypothetical protein
MITHLRYTCSCFTSLNKDFKNFLKNIWNRVTTLTRLPQLKLLNQKERFSIMKNLNNDLVNKLAMEIINTNDKETKDLYYTMLFEELEGWVNARANKFYGKLRGYKAILEDIIGFFHDTIQNVLEGKGFTAYDINKGDFVAVVYNEVRNPIRDYEDYLKAGKRSVTKEGKSLNESVNTDADNSLGDLIADNRTDVAKDVSNSLFVANLLDEFSASVKDGQAKSIYLAMYPEMYDNQDVAEALGYEAYNAGARKKLQRVRQEFQSFMSQHEGLIPN